MLFRLKPLLRLMLFVLLGWACLPSWAQLVVTSTADSGAGTLRQALQDVLPGGTITFSLSANSTIGLESTLTIDKNLTITGPGADLLTLDGGSGWFTSPGVLPSSGHRILDITPAATAVTISGLRFRNGFTTGAGAAGAATGENGAAIRILGSGSVTIDGCWFSHNHAQDRADDPPVGGAIHLDQGTLTVIGSSFHDNFAGAGSAISNHAGTVALTNCTLSGNVAYAGGAFIHVPAGKTSTLERCTVTDNLSINTHDSGGISVIDGSVELKDCIVSGNSPGRHVTLFTNYVDLDPNWQGAGTVTSQGGNILGTNADVAFNPGTRDVVGTLAAASDPKLQSLNLTRTLGGRAPYHPIPSDSPAINNGVGTGGVDQRGFTRIGNADSGAYEYIPVTISGSAGVTGVALSYTDGTAKTATSGVGGSYSFQVPPLWTGVVTPSLSGYTFAPASRSYPSALLSDQTGQDFTATPDQAPAITSAAGVTFALGSPGTFTVTTTGSPTGSVMVLSQSGTLPSGITFTDNHDGTGTLAGTPGAGTSGAYSITISASNGVLPNAGQSFTLTVSQAPAITSASGTTFTVGSPGTFTVTTTGYPAGSAMTLSRSGALPSGITFTDNQDGTATLSGTPGAGTGGTHALTFGANNGISPEASQSFTLTIHQAPAMTSGDTVTFTELVPGTFTVTTSGYPTGTSMVLAQSGSLPSTVTFTDNRNGTATLAGTAALGTNGDYVLTLTAANGVGSEASQSFTLKVLPAAPETITNPASLVSATGATLNGTVNARGANTTVGFEYGATTAYGNSASATPGTMTGTSSTAASASITGLTPNTTYHFRILAVNAGGSSQGSDQSFTTSALAPTITSTSVSPISDQAATWNGTVNAYNAGTAVTFEYGLTNALGQTATAAPSPVNGLLDTAVSVPLSGLRPLTRYYYRAVATSIGGTTRTSIQDFTTLPASQVVVQTPSPSRGSAGTVITLRGTGFTLATSVVIGGLEALFTVIDDTQINCIVPPGAATGPIRVTSPAGTGSSSSFTVELGG